LNDGLPAGQNRYLPIKGGAFNFHSREKGGARVEFSFPSWTGTWNGPRADMRLQRDERDSNHHCSLSLAFPFTAVLSPAETAALVKSRLAALSTKERDDVFFTSAFYSSPASPFVAQLPADSRDAFTRKHADAAHAHDSSSTQSSARPVQLYRRSTFVDLGTAASDSMKEFTVDFLCDVDFEFERDFEDF
jgi:hypothetical protein